MPLNQPPADVPMGELLAVQQAMLAARDEREVKEKLADRLQPTVTQQMAAQNYTPEQRAAGSWVASQAAQLTGDDNGRQQHSEDSNLTAFHRNRGAGLGTAKPPQR